MLTKQLKVLIETSLENGKNFDEIAALLRIQGFDRQKIDSIFSSYEAGDGKKTDSFVKEQIKEQQATDNFVGANGIAIPQKPSVDGVAKPPTIKVPQKPVTQPTQAPDFIPTKTANTTPSVKKENEESGPISGSEELLHEVPPGFVPEGSKTDRTYTKGNPGARTSIYGDTFTSYEDQKKMMSESESSGQIEPKNIEEKIYPKNSSQNETVKVEINNLPQKKSLKKKKVRITLKNSLNSKSSDKSSKDKDSKFENVFGKKDGKVSPLKQEPVIMKTPPVSQNSSQNLPQDHLQNPASPNQASESNPQKATFPLKKPLERVNNQPADVPKKSFFGNRAVKPINVGINSMPEIRRAREEEYRLKKKDSIVPYVITIIVLLAVIGGFIYWFFEIRGGTDITEVIEVVDETDELEDVQPEEPDPAEIDPFTGQKFEED